jgi:hypothetical protein
MTELDLKTETTTAPPNGAQQPQQASAPAQAGAPSGSKYLTIDHSQMGRIKREERAKGVNALLKQFGVATEEELKEKLAGKARPSEQPRAAAPQPPRAQGPSNGKASDTRTAKEFATVAANVEELKRDKARLQKRVRQLEEQLSTAKADGELRVTAVQNGVKDVDYSLAQLRRHCQGKPVEELKSFSVEKFFQEDLRKSHPYLYGEHVEKTEPATTGNGAPPMRTVTQQAPPTPRVSGDAPPPMDAMKMSRPQYEEHLRKLGLSVH